MQILCGDKLLAICLNLMLHNVCGGGGLKGLLWIVIWQKSGDWKWETSSMERMSAKTNMYMYVGGCLYTHKYI